jgi:PleD family two-component response regulator
MSRAPRSSGTGGMAGVADVEHGTETGHRAKILLVDDRSENLLALEAILSSLEQELVSVRSGEAAVDAAMTDEFAVILLDVVMPGMDGFETAAQLKQRGRTPDVPIIFLTAAGDRELAFRGYAVGGSDYISKPFDPWVLRAKVSVFVELFLAGRRLEAAAGLGTLLASVEEAAAGLPAAAAGMARLNGAISELRAAVDGLTPPPSRGGTAASRPS